MSITIADLKKLTPVQLEQVRYACKTDLWFLYDNILRNPKNKRELPLSETCHRPIINNFVKKDPAKTIEQQSNIKLRLYLSARGTLKTTLDGADCVQWILCFPDIRIVILSGKLDHAKEMVGLVIKWFQENELLRFLFPLYCPDIHEKLPSDKFECPARTPGIVQRGSTIAIGSTESGWAGAHGEVVKLDDFENEKNTATQDLRQARIDDFDDLDPVVEPGGYVDVLGTLWGEDDDLYCELIKRNAKWIAEGHDPEMLIVKQPVWKLKPGVELKKVKEEDIEWVIWEKLNLGNLIKQARANPHKFSRQYLMEVLPSEVKSFNLAMLQRQIRPASELPQPHRCWSFQNWDLAGTSNKPGVDKSVGYNVFFDDLGEMFAVDCVSERFSTPTELATAIVMLAKQWKPVKIRIEESLGARNLEPTIIAIAKREKVNVPIIWVPPVKEKNAKINRISLLEPGLKTNKIKFLAGLPYIDVLFEQLMHHPNYSGRRHDDEADCLAQLWEYFKDKVYSISILEMQPDPEELFIFRTRDSHLRSDDRVEIKNTEEECIDGLPNVLSEGLFG